MKQEYKITATFPYDGNPDDVFTGTHSINVDQKANGIYLNDVCIAKVEPKRYGHTKSEYKQMITLQSGYADNKVIDVLKIILEEFDIVCKTCKDTGGVSTCEGFAISPCPDCSTPSELAEPKPKSELVIDEDLGLIVTPKCQRCEGSGRICVDMGDLEKDCPVCSIDALPSNPNPAPIPVVECEGCIAIGYEGLSYQMRCQKCIS